MKRLNYIEDSLNQKFSGWEPSVDPAVKANVWEAVQASLPAPAPAPVSYMLKGAVAFAFLLTVATSIWYVKHSEAVGTTSTTTQAVAEAQVEPATKPVSPLQGVTSNEAKAPKLDNLEASAGSQAPALGTRDNQASLSSRSGYTPKPKAATQVDGGTGSNQAIQLGASNASARNPKPEKVEIHLYLPKSTYCTGEAVQLQAYNERELNSLSQVYWGDELSDFSSASTSHVYASAGAYTVNVWKSGTLAQYKVHIIEPTAPVIQHKVVEGRTVSFSSTQAVDWLLSDGTEMVDQAQVVHTFKDTGFYSITAVSRASSACEARNTTSIYIPSVGSIGTIPNVLTPNGDGANDEFIIPIERYEQYELVIQDLRGNVVFRSTDASQSWQGNASDGTPCEDGRYLYLLRYQLKGSSGGEKKSGYLNIRR